MLSTNVEQAAGWSETIWSLLGYDLYAYHYSEMDAGPLGYYDYRSPAALFERDDS